MSFLKRLFGYSSPNSNEIMRPLYRAIVAQGRAPHWYEQGHVPDSMDGRFDMISSLLALILLRMEAMPILAQQAAWLTEIFVQDMDAQMREAGIGDVVIAKDMGKVMGLLGGRIGAFRGALENADQGALRDVILRNIYGETQIDAKAMTHCIAALTDFWQNLQQYSAEDLMGGKIV